MDTQSITHWSPDIKEESFLSNDSIPFQEEGIKWYPVRALAEALDYEVSYADQETHKQITFSSPTNKRTLTIEEFRFTSRLEGNTNIYTGQSANFRTINDRLFCSPETLAQILGLTYDCFDKAGAFGRR